MKKCICCKTIKPIDKYYRHSRMSDGHLNKCIDCIKAYSSSRYKIKRKDPDFVEKERKRGRDKCKRLRYSSKKYRNNNKEKYRAHSIVSNAIRSGKLVKMPCRICGTDYSIEAHHFDYSKPLSIHWYCSRHHKRIHRYINYLKTKGK